MNLVEKAQEIARSSVMLTEKGLAEDILMALTQALREGGRVELMAVAEKVVPDGNPEILREKIRQRLAELGEEKA